MSEKVEPAWRGYEKVARTLIEKFKEHFGFDQVEGKQDVPGSSGASWEIDARGFRTDGGFAIIECRRYTSGGINQEQMAGLAWRIQDTGADGGLTVSPLDPQKGAQIVAGAANIEHVHLRADSTPEEYLMKFLDRIFLGLSDDVGVTVSDSFTITVRNENGDVVDTRSG